MNDAAGALAVAKTKGGTVNMIKRMIKQMIERKSVLAAVLLAVGTSGAAAAGPVEDLTTFTAGTPARADEVNGNFSNVADAVNDNDARIAVVEDELAEVCADLTSEVTGHTTIYQAAFHPLRSTTVHELDSAGGRFCSAGFPSFEGVFDGLPDGARLTEFQFRTFDSSLAENMFGFVKRTCYPDVGGPVVTVLTTYASSGSGGFQTAFDAVDADLEIIDGQCTYTVVSRLDGQESADCSEGNNLRIVGARATWVRQVSPNADTLACGN